AEAVERTGRAVGAPAGGFVEAARARIVGERPEDRVVAAACELFFAAGQQSAARAFPPAAGIDVEPAELAVALGQPARGHRGPPDQAPLVFGDEAGVAGLPLPERFGPPRPVERHPAEPG